MRYRNAENSITREELYKLVWSKPIMELSEEFGLSDRGLGKVCERHDIPKPPRGYWRKIETGQEIKIPKLPATKDRWKETISINRNIDSPLSESLVSQIKEHMPEKIIIPKETRKSHPLIKYTEKAVRKDLRQRRNLFLQALFLELEKHGYGIEMQEGFFKISFEKECVYLNISEHLKRNKRQLTEKEAKKKIYSVQKWHYEYEETGKLKISLHRYTPGSYSSWLIKSFLDSKNELVEAKINDVYKCIIEYLFKEREERIRKEEEERIRREKEKQARIKKKKTEILLEETKSFMLATNIREYINTKETAYRAGKVDMIDFNEWKNFAINYANEIDPSLKNEVEVADDYVEYRYW